MTPERRAQLAQECHNQAVYLKHVVAEGKVIPSLSVIIPLFKILEEVLKDDT